MNQRNGYFVFALLVFSLNFFIFRFNQFSKDAEEVVETLSYKQYISAFNQGLMHLRQPASEIFSEDKLVMPSGFKPGAVFSVIKEPSILFELEKRGFSLPDHFSQDFSKVPVLNFRNDQLIKNSLYKSFSEVIVSDIEEIKKQEEKGVRSAQNARSLDPDWLRSPIARYELVGVMNRLDRVSFDPAHCGEMRFVYRLSYDSQEDNIYSRLPMTLMVKYLITHQSGMSWEDEKRAYSVLPGSEKRTYGNKVSAWDQCKRFARSWVYPKKMKNPEKLLRWMTSNQGPLGSQLLTVGDFFSVETNIQAVRVPSGARSKLAGHAVYLLRVFSKVA